MTIHNSPISDPANLTRNQEFDQLTPSIIIMDAGHHRVHEGVAFYYRDVITLSSSGTQDYVLVTPLTPKMCHWGYSISSELQVTTELYEGTDKTPTTLQTLYNRNRNSSNTPSMLLYKGDSGGTTDGTRILWRIEGSSSQGNSTAVVVGTELERILKYNTKYIFRLTSGANNNIISIKFDWYEISPT